MWAAVRGHPTTRTWSPRPSKKPQRHRRRTRRRSGPSLEVAASSRAAAALVEKSAQADLLVVGSRGRGGFRGLVWARSACNACCTRSARSPWCMPRAGQVRLGGEGSGATRSAGHLRDLTPAIGRSRDPAASDGHDSADMAAETEDAPWIAADPSPPRRLVGRLPGHRAEAGRPPWFARRPQLTVFVAIVLYVGVLGLRFAVDAVFEPISLCSACPSRCSQSPSACVSDYSAGIAGVALLAGWADRGRAAVLARLGNQSRAPAPARRVARRCRRPAAPIRGTPGSPRGGRAATPRRRRTQRQHRAAHGRRQVGPGVRALRARSGDHHRNGRGLSRAVGGPAARRRLASPSHVVKEDIGLTRRPSQPASIPSRTLRRKPCPRETPPWHKY